MHHKKIGSVPYLYFLQRSTKPQYGTVPTKQCDPARLATGRPAWRQPTESSIPKKKTIVLADWTVRYLADDDQRYASEKILIKNILLALLENQFELYYLDDSGQAKQLKREEFDELHIEKYFPKDPINDQDIESAILKQKKIAKDSLFILNDYWMSILGRENPSVIKQSRLLKTSACYAYGVFNEFTPEKKKNLLNYVKSAQPSYSQIETYTKSDTESELNLIECIRSNNHANNGVEDLINAEPNNLDKINRLFETLIQWCAVANSEAEDGLYVFSSDTKNPFSLQKFSIAKKNYVNFNYLDAFFCEGNFQLILDQFTRLERIDFRDDRLYFDNLSNKKLENLRYISYSPYKSNYDQKVLPLSVEKVINAAINLKTLELKMIEELDFKTLPITSLEELLLDLSNFKKISLIDLLNFISSQSNLKKLVIKFPENKNTEIIGDLTKIPPLVLPKLQELKILNNLSGDHGILFIEKLLVGSTNISDLTIENNKLDVADEKRTINLKDVKFPYLRNLYIKAYLQLSQDIMNCSSNLEGFTLSRVYLNPIERISRPISSLRYLSMNTNLQNTGLKIIESQIHLKSIYLSWNPFIPTRDRISLLLLSIRNMESIALEGKFPQYFSAELPHDLNFPKLKQLELDSEDMQRTDFITLIKTMPRLNKLLLRGNWTQTLDSEIIAYLNERHIEIIPESIISTIKEKSSENEPPQLNPEKPGDWHHNHKYFFDYVPSKNFDLTDIDPGSMSQDMIIKKLASYINLKYPKLINWIDAMPDGICHILTKIFLDMKTVDWDNVLKKLKQWNNESTLPDEDVQKFFEEIIKWWKKVYVDADPNYFKDYTFLGDNFTEFLINEGKRRFFLFDESFVVSSPWHCIAVKYRQKNRDGKGEWIIYDPNNEDGCKKFASDDIDNAKSFIEFCLEKIYAVKIAPFRIRTSLKIENPEAFIAQGGLIGLKNLGNFDEVMSIISKDVSSILPATLKDALFIRAREPGSEGYPALLVCILSDKTKLADFAMTLLYELYKSYEDKNEFAKFLIGKMKHLEWTDAFITLLTVKIGNLSKNNSSDQFKITSSALIEAISSFKPAVTLEEKIPARSVAPRIEPHVMSSGTTSVPPQEVKSTGTPEKTTIIETLKDNPYAKSLETWKQRASDTITLQPFLQEMVAIPGKTSGDLLDNKRLIETLSSQHVKALSLSILQHCARTKRPVFYVHSPADLICSAPYIELHGNKGIIKKNKNGGGRLFDFLQKNQDKANPPIILIAYDKFTTEDKIKFKGLLEEKRHVDGTPLADYVTIVGIDNTAKPFYFRSSDFHGKFSSKQLCSLNLTELFLEDFPLPEITVAPETEVATTINLFHTDDWEERLVGRWVIKDNELFFQEGPLIKSIKDGVPVRILNGPWGNDEFEFFWKKLFATRTIECASGIYPISSQFTLSRSEGYAQNLNKATLTQDTNGYQDIANVETLNPSNYRQFITREICDIDKETLTSVDGILASYRNQPLHVNVTRDLNEDQWAELLTECQKFGVNLICHYASEKIRLPYEFKPFTNSQIIESTDVDATVARLNEINPSKLIIDCKGLDTHHLLISLQASFDEKNMRFKFSEKEAALLKALHENKHVILTNPATELCDALAPLLLKQQAGQESQANITIVTSHAPALSGFQIYQDTVSEQNKRDLLTSRYGAEAVMHIDKYISKESFCKLAARARYYRRMSASSDINTDDAWKGMHALEGGIKLKPFDLARSKELAAEFVEKRQDGIKQGLQHSPFLFLTGLTGVGKTSHIEKYLTHDPEIRVHFGDTAMIQWAQDQTPNKLKVLFIDEANIANRSWSEFDGLFHQPPSILINGELYPLTKDHKVIFAGNPMSYGGEREFAEFFERHGNALLFEPMPLEFIHEYIIKPVFDHQKMPRYDDSIALAFLNIYKFLCECSTSEVLISPRELQMMALLTISHLDKYPQDNPAQVAEHYAYLVGQHLVPSNKKVEFDRLFLKKTDISHTNIPAVLSEKSHYVQIPSHQPAIHLIHDMLNLREFRTENTGLNEAQQYGGLGGIIIEGPPDTGKKTMVISQLLNRGYRHVNLQDKIIPANAFYIMPTSMSLEDKESLLLKAFNEGAIVVIDAINSSPMMERLMNDLLMGKAPGGIRPEKPGFNIIGIQRPITTAGTQATSSALARRVITVSIHKNTREENQAILMQGNTSPRVASLLAIALEEKQLQAEKQRLSPAPTLRDALRLAKQNSEKTLERVPETIITVVSDVPDSAPTLFPSTIDLLWKITESKLNGINSNWHVLDEDTETGKTLLRRVISKDAEKVYFTVYSDKLTTNCQDTETMIAILQCLKTINPHWQPTISSANAENAARWQDARLQVYHGKSIEAGSTFDPSK